MGVGGKKKIRGEKCFSLTDYRAGAGWHAMAERWSRHLSHLKMYLMTRISDRIFAITSSCMRLKHMAISAMPETHAVKTKRITAEEKSDRI